MDIENCFFSIGNWVSILDDVAKVHINVIEKGMNLSLPVPHPVTRYLDNGLITGMP